MKKHPFFILFFIFLTPLFSLDADPLSEPIHSEKGQRPKKMYLAKALAGPVSEKAQKISLADIDGEPSGIIHNCVNVVSGQYFDSQTDLVLHHAVDPISIERNFLGSTEKSGFLGDGWSINHLGGINYDVIESPIIRRMYLYLKGDHGEDILYENDVLYSQEFKRLWISDGYLDKGAVNTSRGFISGQTNIKNNKVDYGKEICTCRDGAGVVKKYHKLKGDKEFNFRLLEVNKPSGNTLKYNYVKPNYSYYLDKISLFNKTQKEVGSIDLEVTPQDVFRKKLSKKITTPDGRWVNYQFNKGKYGKYILDSVNRSDGSYVEYEYKRNRIKRKKLPDNRYVEICYPSLGLIHVKKLLAPAGKDATPVPIYSFSYKNKIKAHTEGFKEGCTCTVYDAIRNKVVYSIDKNHRLVGIEKFTDDNDKNYTKESIFWFSNKDYDNTCLNARCLTHHNVPLFIHNYHYDNSGNVSIDCLYGNLTGQNTHIATIDEKGNVTPNGSECYKKEYEYSEDGLNLLLQETDGRKSIHYEYLHKSNRLKAKFSDKKRHFYSYNNDAALVKEIVDDGQTTEPSDLKGVTQRLITYYTPLTTYPVGYAQIVEQKYLDLKTKKEHLLHKVVNTYNNQGLITQQEHYNNKNALAYTLSWEFDAKGNIIKEIDAIQRIIERRFDDNNNCVYQKGPNPDFHKLYSYDFMNRLIKEEEVHEDIHLTVTHEYDLVGNKISTSDQFGNVTDFEYDAFGRVIKITHPECLDKDDKPYRSTVTKAYDPLGNVICETDSYGVETHKTYNIKGELTSTHYPDGSVEKNVYNLGGTLHYSIAKNGNKTIYTYDLADRPVEIEVVSAKGERLSLNKKTYSGFHLLSETDAMGIVTHYRYYPSGHLKSKKQGDFLSTYFYDSLLRLVKTIEVYGPGKNDFIVKSKKYDLANRVIEEKVEDFSKPVTCISYSYDHSDHLVKSTIKTNDQANVATTLYDSHGIPIVAIDAEGNKTTTVCNYRYRNKQNQYVLLKQITDPLSNQTQLFHDALGRVVKTSYLNAAKNELKKQSNFYDKNGNLSLIVDHVKKEGKAVYEIKTLMEYDTSNRLMSCFEAFGSSDQKQTKIIYNKIGQKQTLIKADQSQIHHHYDGLGRLSRLYSSDKTIDYKYKYDNNNNPIYVEDCINKTATTRSYNKNNQLIKETLANKCMLEYVHDYIGRPLNVLFHDGSAIAYDYQGSLLKTIDRISTLGKINYSHEYKAYDLSGDLLESTLIGNAGRITYTFDALRRFKSAMHLKWNERITSYDAVGNILGTEMTDDQGNVKSQYAYDDLYQLKKEKGVSELSYSYDSNNNRLSKNKDNYSLNQLNQITNDRQFAYVYDKNGNLRSKKSKDQFVKYSYDALDRLTTIEEGEDKYQYSYDEMNRRLSKTAFKKKQEQWVTGETWRYLYQGQNEIGLCDKNNVIRELRVLGIGKGAEIGAAVAIEIEKKVYAPLHNFMGSVACLIDKDTGEVVESYRYTAFGEELFEGGLTSWRFSSKRVDEESGFVYFGRRYYDPMVGRWISADPIGREGGPNLYAYVLNKPLTNFDLYGLMNINMLRRNQRYANNSGEGIKRVLQFPGKMIQDIAFNFLPIPFVKDMIEFGGWCLQGKNPSHYWSHERYPSHLHFYEGKKGDDPRFRMMSYNGIGVSPSEMDRRSASLSEMYGGINIYSVYNASNGFILDLLEVGCQKLGIGVYTQNVAEKSTAAVAASMGEGCTLYALAHSQGAQTVNNLSASLKSMMNVTALGPARVLNKNEFSEAKNYVATYDFVTPVADAWGLRRGLIDGNVEYVQSKGNPLFNHFFDGQSYGEVISKQAENFRTSYGL